MNTSTSTATRQELFQPIEKLDLRARIVGQIGELVRSGHLQPHDKLPPERQLQQMLNVSRPLLREALQQLTTAGLIEARPGRGWYVADSTVLTSLSRPLSQHLLRGEITIAELLQARKVIEGETAALAAEVATSADFAALSDLLRTMHVTRDDPTSRVEVDAAFHGRIAAIAGNRLLERILASMDNLLTEYRRLLVATVPERNDVANAEHERIVAAIARHDKEAAAAEMRAHLDAVSVEVEAPSRRYTSMLGPSTSGARSVTPRD